MKKQKLELTWIGKDERLLLEPRILIEDSQKSYHASQKIAESDVFDNRIIFGDNLLALKALEQEFAEKIKCIYIDPPYNTGSAFEEYNDGVEHSLWLSLMRERLVLLWRLLSSDNGVLLISINDDEVHYLKVMCDELFGRDKFIASLVWHYEGNTDNQARIINYHEYVLVYSKSGQIDPPGVVDPNIDPESKLFRDEIRNTIVKNGPKNPVSSVLLPVGFPANFEEGILPISSTAFPQYKGKVRIENGKTTNEVTVSSGWSSKAILCDFIKNNFNPVLDSKGQLTSFELTRTGAIEAVKQRKQEKGHFVSVLRGFGTTNQMRLLLDKIGVKFTFPKPVGLVSYLIEAFSQPNDIILDSFAGSGTTGHAVLDLNLRKKSKRKFILVELEESTVNNILIPRIKAVINGNAAAEIPPHGGGFRFYNLAPSLLEQDVWGNWVISKEFNPTMLAESVCKLNGFTYAPSDRHFWIHGYSSERDFIYVTTQTLTREQLAKISEEVGESRSLLVCCGAFRVKADSFQNITLRKIPKAVLSKCEWGRDDYSLKVNELPLEEIQPTVQTSMNVPRARSKNERRASTNQGQLGLFERGK